MPHVRPAAIASMLVACAALAACHGSAFNAYLPPAGETDGAVSVTDDALDPGTTEDAPDDAMASPGDDVAHTTEPDATTPPHDATVVPGPDVIVAPGPESGVPCGVLEQRCNGVCAQVLNDDANCGACGRGCGAFAHCTGGVCLSTCLPPGAVCGSSCVQLLNDANHCGACDRACSSGGQCLAGQCTTPVVCTSGETMCASGCADLASDGRNCGTCGHVCATGTACLSGTCTTVCASGQTRCGTTCVDTSSNDANCGHCGTACGSNAHCTAGACIPTCTGAGAMVCGTRCVDTTSDRANCGTCGNACADGGFCTAGTCGAAPVYTSYDITTVPFGTFDNACTITPASDIVSGAATTGGATVTFPFVYWDRVVASFDTSQSGVMVGRNAVPFGYGNSGCDTGTVLPAYAVAPLWSEFVMRGGSRVCATTTGTPGARRMVATWSGVAYARHSDTRPSFSAVFYESTNVIEFVYGAGNRVPVSDAGMPEVHTVGLTGTLAPSRSAVRALCSVNPGLAGVRLRFTPRP